MEEPADESLRGFALPVGSLLWGGDLRGLEFLVGLVLAILRSGVATEKLRWLPLRHELNLDANSERREVNKFDR